MNAHIHAENMRLYAEDATKTDKPWELWEFISFGMEDYQTLESNPNWDFATAYRRKIKKANPRDAERYHWMRETFVDDGVVWPRDVSLAKTGEELDAAIDAASRQPRQRINSMPSRRQTSWMRNAGGLLSTKVGLLI